jgi:DNA-binding response OmpR family regulator
VDTHIAELRRKLEPEATEPLHILTVRKIGYRLDPAPANRHGAHASA